MLNKYNIYVICNSRNSFIRRYLTILTNRHNIIKLPDEDNIDVLKNDYEYEALLNKYLNVKSEQQCFLIHPYVKWGPKKIKISTPQNQLKEAVSLIDSLETWKVADKVIVPLDNLERKLLFGKGTLAKLTQTIQTSTCITCIFINISILKNIQLEELEKKFGLPIFDRYSIVMQIFRLYATSKHAKLQVALAETFYLQYKLKRFDADFVVRDKYDTKNLILHARENKIKDAIKKLRFQRELLRNKRSKNEFPVVAVIGYTNVGKTSLIKTLTEDKSLIPKNQFFATLNITFHAGLLPSFLKVLYVDTVGFLSNIPSELIECFKATLEDAILADVILHVEDLSSPDFLYQKQHVINTLQTLSESLGMAWKDIESKIIAVGNKSDEMDKNNETTLKVSAKTGRGIDSLRDEIENKILETTRRHRLSISIPIGGNEMRWLYKNATVVEVKEDESNIENYILKVIITEANLNQFNHNFVT